MDRFRTLPGVILNNDRVPLQPAEELSVVIGLAAARLRQRVEGQDETLFTNVRRIGLALAAGVLLLAVVGAGWLISNGQSASLPALIVAAVVLLALIGLGLGLAPYSKRFRVSAEQAAVTRVARLYWPVGILPLDGERALLWDALSDKSAGVDVIDLPPAVGLELESAAATARKADTVFDALLRFETELRDIRSETTAWPAARPDASMEQLGAEAADLWKRMSAPMNGDPGSVLGFLAASGAEAWRTVADEGERVHTFHREIESMRLLTERYLQRARHLVDRARELTVEHGFGVMQAVEDARSMHFRQPEAESPALAPGDTVHVSAATSAGQIRENLASLAASLAPLDEHVASELNHLARAEEADIRAVEGAHQPEREQIEQDERNIAQRDSDILKLAHSLEVYQKRILESREKILTGYERIAEIPVAELNAEVRALDSAVAGATQGLTEATPRMDLPGLDRTVADLGKALTKAHQSWQRLATDLPRRGQDVQSRLESIQTSLQAISEGHLALSPADVTDLLASVKNVERVTRDMVSWTNSQQDPLSPIEDHDRVLVGHLAALDDLRLRLEQSRSTFAAATSPNGESEGEAALPSLLARADRLVSEFARLSDETSSAAAALNNAAETVQKQSRQIEQLLVERDEARRAFEQRSSALLATIQRERDAIRESYSAKREAIAALRGRLDELPKAVESRLERALADPSVLAGGVLADSEAVPWTELIVNQMGLAVDDWGKRVAGIDGEGEEAPVLLQLRGQIEAAHDAILAQSVPARLNPEDQPLSPHLCFVPFWYVETETNPGAEAGAGRMIHLYPPLHLDRPAPAELPAIESLRYRELSRRLLSYLRRDYLDGGDPAGALDFDPVVLTDLAKSIPVEAGTPMWQEVATALAQHWVFFRSEDPLLSRIILNSRDHLLPTGQMVDASLASSQQGALTDEGA